jgi:signal peptidase I
VTRADDFPGADSSSPGQTPDPADPGFADDLLARIRRRAAYGDPPETAAPPVVAAPLPPNIVTGDPLGSPRPALQPHPSGLRYDAIHDPADTSAIAAGDGSGGGADIGEGGSDDGEGDDDAKAAGSRRTRNLIEWIGVALGALLVAFLIRAFLLQAFYIPSESMEPTLHKQDRILVNKLSYKLHDVHRGDLVVFEKPPNEANSTINDLIKRVVALGGETIEEREGKIYIDDRLLTEPYLRNGQNPGPDITWVEGCSNPSTERTKCTIPDGHVWVMGDNRDHSHDSRFFGPIDDDLIVGRAFVKVWPLNKIGFL